MTPQQWEELQEAERLAPTGQVPWLLACLCAMVYQWTAKKGSPEQTAEDFYFDAPPLRREQD